jgi:hypothetical protein
MNIPNRLMLSLKLLKKELEMSRLQNKISKDVSFFNDFTKEKFC